MKTTKILAMTFIALALAGCDNANTDTPEQQVPVKTKKFTFTCKGDFTSDWKPVTKKAPSANEYLTADGKEMTDLWVLDYWEGELDQQLHQTPEDEDWGAPVMQLKYGSHHVYFIASRGQNPTLNTTAKTITFTKVLDTFYKDYQVSVVATSNGNRAVTLERNVTKLKLVFTDAIPDNAATINIAPHTWYYGFNYQTGAPCEEKTDYVMSINIPAASHGSTSESANLFGFSTADEWTTDVAANSKTSANVVLGSCTIEDAPFKANRVTEYSGPLFSSGGTMTVSLDTDWDTTVTGTW